MAQIIVRHDDFDFRLQAEEYINIHQKFVERELIETAVVQLTHEGNEKVYQPELITYMNKSPYWNIQFHGWKHWDYGKMPREEIEEDLGKSMDKLVELFEVYPTVWFPPWNSIGQDMLELANSYGLAIDNESYDIAKFIREVKAGTYQGHSFYFHGWKADEVAQLDEALDLVVKLKEKNADS